MEEKATPTKMQRVLGWARELGILVVVGLVVAFAVSWVRAPDLDVAPDFALPNLDGEVVSLSDFRGETVVVNFWATWCGPCRVEAPSFSSFAEAHPDVVVLGVAADGPAAKLRHAKKDLGITYTVLQAEGSVLEDYGVSAFPTTVVVNPDGSVRWVHTGMMMRPMIAWSTGRLW
ncbi:MAG: TlpA family protein disulfide reductase [Proteobacteria bacterium]|nr:TlpA family protein disulfide reductase [Pseudomonadota bacterium]